MASVFTITAQLPARPYRWATLALLAALMLPAAAMAQGSVTSNAPNALQGFSQNRNKPISIDAATLEVRDKDRIATFSGDVKVVQGDTTMRAKTLVVYYDTDAPAGGGKAASKTVKAATPGPAGASQIKRLEAKGGVTVAQKEPTVTGERGVFDMRSNTVTVEGGIVLTNGDNVLRGEKLSVDLTSGISRIDPGKGGRVQGLFKSKPGGAESGPGGGRSPLSVVPGGR